MTTGVEGISWLLTTHPRIFHFKIFVGFEKFPFYQPSIILPPKDTENLPQFIPKTYLLILRMGSLQKKWVLVRNPDLSNFYGFLDLLPQPWRFLIDYLMQQWKRTFLLITTHYFREFLHCLRKWNWMMTRREPRTVSRFVSSSQMEIPRLSLSITPQLCQIYTKNMLLHI